MRRLDGQRAHRLDQPQRLLACEPALGLGCERRRPDPEVALPLCFEPLAQPGRGVLHAAVLGEAPGELLGGLLRLELGELGLLVGEQVARLELEQRGDQDEELAADVEVELVAFGEPLDECDDDPGHVDLGRLDRVLEEECQQKVERALERVEVQLEVADGTGHGVTLTSRSDAALRHGHLRSAGRRCRTRRAVTPLGEPEPDEARDADEARDPGVHAQAEDVVRGSMRNELDPEAAEGVERDVEREEPRWPRVEPPLDHVDEQARGEQVPQDLVEERWVVGHLIDGRERSMDRVDLEAPGQVGRLPEELLVPPVADATHGLGDEKPWCEAVGEQPDVRAGTLGDEAADEAAERDPAPDAEAALPDRERVPTTGRGPRSSWSRGGRAARRRCPRRRPRRRSGR